MGLRNSLLVAFSEVSQFHCTTRCPRVHRRLPNMRLLLSRFALVGKGRSPCSEPPSATSIAAQQNR